MLNHRRESQNMSPRAPFITVLRSSALMPIALAALVALAVFILTTTSSRGPATDPALAGSKRLSMSGAFADGPFHHADTWYIPSRFGAITDLSLGPDGTLVLADGARHVIEVIDPDGRAAVTITAPDDLVLDRSSLIPVGLELDATGSTIDIVWQRFGQPVGTTSEALREAFFERRSIDGTVVTAAVRMAGGATPVTDVGHHPSSGDVYVVRGGMVLRLIGGDATTSLLFELPSSISPPERIAVLESGFVLIGSGDAWLVDDAGAAAALDLGIAERPALAVSTMEGGGFGILLAQGDSEADPDAEPDAEDDLILAFGVDGDRTPLGDMTVGDVGMAPPPVSGWPWALASAGPHLAVTGLLPDGGMVARRSGPYPLNLFGLDADSGAEALVHSVEPLGISNLEAIAVEGRPSPEGGIVVASCETVHAPVDVAGGCSSEFAAAHSLAPDGAARDGLSLGAGLQDLAADLEGAVYAGFSGVIEREWRDTSTIGAGVSKLGTSWSGPVWDRSCECESGGSLAVLDGTVITTGPVSRVVAGFDTVSGEPTSSITARDTGGLWPSDVAFDSSGRILTADTGKRSIERWETDGAYVGGIDVGAGLAFGPRRISSGVWNDVPVIAALTSDGYVELHSEEVGDLLVRWLPTDSGGSPIEVRDLTFDSSGRLLFIEWGRPDILVFEPQEGAWEPPVPTPGPTPIPPPDACEISMAKTARPETVVLGETAEVRLGFAADCPPREGESIGADVMLILWPGVRFDGVAWREKISFVERWLALVDYDSHRVGAVSMAYKEVLTVVPLDAAPLELVSTLRGIPETSFLVAADDLAGIAHETLNAEGRDGALKVMVLISSLDWHGRGVISPQVFEDAAAARASGILTYAIDLGGSDSALEGFAGSAERTFGKPSPREVTTIMGHIVREAGLSLSGNLIVDDTMSDDVWYEEGSALPPAIVGSGVSDLRWSRSVIPSTGLSLTYRVRPLRTGRIPTNLEAIARYDDVDGVRREVVFPVPMIDVVAPTATPTPTPTATPGAIYLPLAIADVCVRTNAPLDVALAIDISSSMSGEKLAAARAAARRFIEALDLESGRDRAAVIAFDDVAVAVVELTSDRAALQRAIDGLSTGRGTRMDRALAVGADTLGSHAARRSDARAVILLLSDGAHAGPTEEVVIVAGAFRRTTGATIWTIGLGPDADAELLRAVADPGAYRFAPDAVALEAVYGALTEEVGCR